jgi:hypothetical protein
MSRGLPSETAYENTADEVWARQALDLYRRRQLYAQLFSEESAISAQVSGTCPSCGHELYLQLVFSTPVARRREGRGLLAALAGRAGSAGVPAAVDVGSGHAHPGAPGQVTGCGVSFRPPTAPPDTPVHPDDRSGRLPGTRARPRRARPVSAAEREAFDALVKKSLPAVRSMVAAWRTGLTALVTLVTTGIILKGRTDTTSLTLP